MKLSTVLLSGAALFSSFAAQAAHYQAEHCEIFVDKISIPGRGSHGVHSLRFNLKILPERLDGEVAEVGMHYKREGTSSGRPLFVDWRDEAAKLVGGNDYYELYVQGDNSFSDTDMWASFYVKTTNGTTYWLNAPEWGEGLQDGNGNYLLSDSPLYRALNEQCYKERSECAYAPTAGTLGYYNKLSAFNPKGCK